MGECGLQGSAFACTRGEPRVRSTSRVESLAPSESMGPTVWGGGMWASKAERPSRAHLEGVSQTLLKTARFAELVLPPFEVCNCRTAGSVIARSKT
jgi:hypothetical protein